MVTQTRTLPRFVSAKRDGAVRVRTKTQPVLSSIALDSYVTVACSGNVIFFMAEPGYGKTFICEQVDMRLRHSHVETDWVRLSDSCGCVAHDSIALIGDVSERMRAHEGHQRTLFIDNLGVLDYSETQALADILRKNSELGVTTVITCRPEASQLLPYFPDAAVFGFDALSVPESQYENWGSKISSLPERNVTLMTHGIPALLAELAGASISSDWDSRVVCTMDTRALVHIMQASVRDVLPVVERCIRFALMLLGEGTFEDVQAIFPRITAAQFLVCGHDAPFFGVRPLDRSFCCTRINHDDVFLACLPDIEAPKDFGPNALMQVIHHLLELGKVQRAYALAKKFVSDELAQNIVLSYPLELIDKGDKDMVFERVVSYHEGGVDDKPVQAGKGVDEALEQPQGGFLGSDELVCNASAAGHVDNDSGVDAAGVAGEPPTQEGNLWARSCFGYAAARAALALVMGDIRAAETLVQAAPEPVNERERCIAQQIQWLRCAVLLMQGKSACLDTIPTSHMVEGLAERFRGMAQALRAILQGEFNQAFELLLHFEPAMQESSMSADLLGGLFRLSQYLVGDSAAMEDPLRVEAFAAPSLQGFPYFKRMHSLLMQALHFLRLAFCIPTDKRYDFKPLMLEVERALARAGEAKAGSLELLNAFIGCVLEYKQGNHLRACVFAARARRCARGMGAGRLEQYAELLHEVASQELGNKPSVQIGGIEADTPLSEVESAGVWLMAMLLHGQFAKLEESANELLTRGLSHDEALLLAMVGDALDARDFGMLPLQSWKCKLEAWKRLIAVTSVAEFTRSDMRKNAQGPAIEVHLLGEFCVMRGGVPVEERAWQRKKAKELVAILAAQPGHHVQRERLIELLWPNCSREEGRGRLYVTLSAARQALGSKKGDASIIGGHGGQLWLSETDVCCDVDTLESALLDAVETKWEDGELVHRALVVSELYPGDMAAIDVDSLLIERRQRELRRKVTDVLIMGAYAALRLKTPIRAYWLAERAVAVDPAREDAHTVLLEALLTQGRELEAKSYYEEFARKMVALNGRPPSGGMRRAMREFTYITKTAPVAPITETATLEVSDILGMIP